MIFEDVLDIELHGFFGSNIYYNWIEVYHFRKSVHIDQDHIIAV
jgi:hypothetical protein